MDPVGLIVGPPPVEDETGDGFNSAIIQLLRQIMQNARDAMASMEAFKEIAKLGKDARVSASKREFKQYDRNSAEIDDQILRVSGMADADPAFNVGDQVTLIQDAWNRAKDAMPAAADFGVDEVSAAVVNDLETAKQYVDKVHYFAARLSLPSQVLDYVYQLRPGNTANLHSILEEDVPEKEQRDELIAYLKTARIGIPAIIDASTGIATRYETDAGKLRNSRNRVIGYLVVPPVLTLLLSWAWPYLPNLHSFIAPEYLATFFAILMGALVGGGLHVAIDILKTRNGPRPEFIASVDDFGFYLNAQETSILIGLGVLWAVAIGTSILQPTVGFAGAIFVGYSADSIADVFLERFQKVVDTQTGSIKTVIGGK
jgi:hypothetical protein